LVPNHSGAGGTHLRGWSFAFELDVDAHLLMTGLEQVAPRSGACASTSLLPSASGIALLMFGNGMAMIAFSSVRDRGIAKPESSAKVRRSDHHRSPELAAISVLICQSTAVGPQQGDGKAQGAENCQQRAGGLTDVALDVRSLHCGAAPGKSDVSSRVRMLTFHPHMLLHAFG
jgi:hypothetical protein